MSIVSILDRCMTCGANRGGVLDLNVKPETFHCFACWQLQQHPFASVHAGTTPGKSQATGQQPRSTHSK